MKGTLSKTVRHFKRGAPILLSCAAAVGVVATAVFAVRATPKAMQLLKRKEYDKDDGEELSKAEIVKTVWLLYIPSAAIGAATVFCIFGANMLSRKQQLALAGAYAMLNNSYRDYKNKVKGIYGEEAHKKILREIAVEKCEDNHITVGACGGLWDTSLDFGVDDEPTRLFYDCYSKRYFEITIENVLKAEYHLNRNFSLRGDATINEFYKFLGLERLDWGDDFGWSVDDGMAWIDFDHGLVVLDDGLECCIIEPVYSPYAVQSEE